MALDSPVCRVPRVIAATRADEAMTVPRVTVVCLVFPGVLDGLDHLGLWARMDPRETEVLRERMDYLVIN